MAYYALIAARSGWTPMMFMTRVRLYASTCMAIPVATFGGRFIRKCVAPEADVKPFSMIRVWWRCGMSAALLVVFPAFASAQAPTPDSFMELETKYILGFTVGW